jgi:hypothetical protein
MIKEDMLDGYSDEDIRIIQSLADSVLKRRDDGRKADATEVARVALAAVGLTFKDVLKTKAKPAKGPQYVGGRTYQHPTNKALVWNAKGQKPKWLRELEADGDKAIELSVNDVLMAKKTG